MEKLKKLKESEEAKDLEADLGILIEDLEKYVVIEDSPFSELQEAVHEVEEEALEVIEEDLEN